MALPYPRLELRWRPSNPEQDDTDLNWACDYVLVIHRATVGDMRSNRGDTYAVKAVEYVLNTSYRGSSVEPYAGDTPFREGAHIQWDSVALNIPAYSVYKGKRKKLKIEPKAIKTAKSRMDGTDTGLRNNRKNKK